MQRKQTDIKVDDSTIVLHPQRESDESVNSAQQIAKHDINEVVKQRSDVTYVTPASRGESVNSVRSGGRCTSEYLMVDVKGGLDSGVRAHTWMA
jgi:hypothetical protein